MPRVERSSHMRLSIHRRGSAPNGRMCGISASTSITSRCSESVASDSPTRRFVRGSCLRPEFVSGWRKGSAIRCQQANDSSPAAARRCAARSRTPLGRLDRTNCPRWSGHARAQQRSALPARQHRRRCGVRAISAMCIRRLSDFSLSDLRESAGAGVRLRTPWFLLRADYGVLLDRREQEPRSRFYFSIGQAF